MSLEEEEEEDNGEEREEGNVSGLINSDGEEEDWRAALVGTTLVNSPLNNLRHQRDVAWS